MQVLISILFVILVWILNGFALKVIWGWFMVPVFGLPALTIPAALGIGILVSYLTQNSVSPDQQTGRRWTAMQLLARPILALGLGALVHLFM